MGNNLADRVGQNVQRRGGPGTEVAQRPQSTEQLIRTMEGQFKMAMPRGLEAAQLVRDAISVMRNTPKLAECEQMSVLGALMTCAQLGLRPGIGALGHAHILPFWSNKNRRFEAQFILGYQGMIELANRSGEIDLIVAREVHENDEFHIDYGTDQLHHVPAMQGRGPVKGYYAKFYRKGGTRPTFEWLSVADAQEHRDRFATAKKKDGTIFGPWVDHFDAMALKTTVRMVFKWMPRSTLIQNAIIADETVRLDYEPTSDLAQITQHVDADDAGTPPDDEPAARSNGTGEVTDADQKWLNGESQS